MVRSCPTCQGPDKNQAQILAFLKGISVFSMNRSLSTGTLCMEQKKGFNRQSREQLSYLDEPFGFRDRSEINLLDDASPAINLPVSHCHFTLSPK